MPGSTQPAGLAWQRLARQPGRAGGRAAAQDSLQRERERICWQIGELDKLAPGDGEWDELNTEHNRLSNAQALLEAAQGAVDGLQDAEPSAANCAAGGAKPVATAGNSHEPAFAALAERSRPAWPSSKTWCIRSRLPAQDRTRSATPGQLDERMALDLAGPALQARAGRSAALLATWRDELARLDAAADLDGLQAAEQAAQAAYLREARLLSRTRTKVALLLAKAITQAMQGLGMEGGRFEVRVQAAAQPMHVASRHRLSGRRACRQHAAAGRQGGLRRRAVTMAWPSPSRPAELGTAQT
jgi:DNA repair protein RecN (Recombination protein N)